MERRGTSDDLWPVEGYTSWGVDKAYAWGRGEEPGVYRNDNEESSLIGSERTDHVVLLIQGGAAVNTIDNNGDKQLHCLCRPRRFAVKLDPGIVVRQLLVASANFNLRNNDGKTPIQLARESLHINPGFEDIPVLQEEGAEFDDSMEKVFHQAA
ncbi:hypothetical protein BR93DRAFT_975436 [Coniochaeta sp. PMI_546]|nr:hypothetical protein BR93DRAFT_975436 [Coniochaeta sp. PMI_546]